MEAKKETNEDAVSEFFLSAVSEIAFQHDCKLLACGYDENGYWVELDGLPKHQAKVFVVLEKAFKKWEVK